MPHVSDSRSWRIRSLRRARRILHVDQHAAMFRSRTSDLHKSLLKLSDTKRDIHARYKHLKTILDHPTTAESKKVLTEDISSVFSVFVENYNALDQALKQKGQKISREDVDSVLSGIERILILLPEYIRSCSPQPVVITTILKRCLHPKGPLKLRRDAVRPMIIYYQILRDLCSEDLHRLFSILVPGLGSGNIIQDELLISDVFETTPPLLLPSSNEKPLENVTRHMYETLIDLLVTQVYRIAWDSPEQFQQSFAFLFDRFKFDYLTRIFPDARSLHDHEKKISSQPVDAVTLSLQVTTLKWIVVFFQTPENVRPEVPADISKRRGRDTSIGSAVQSLLHFDMSVPTSISDPKYKEIYTSNIVLLVRKLFVSVPANTQLLHELFESAFRFPVSEMSLIKRIVNVYRVWIASLQTSEQLKYGNTNSQFAGTDAVDSLPRQVGTQMIADQSVLKNFCTNSLYPFTAELPPGDPASRNAMLDEQEELCKKIIILYRFIVVKLPLSLSTWESVLVTLIRITETLMPSDPPKDRLSHLSGRLALPLFQTLLVTWVKGSLSAVIPVRLWDDLARVLSRMTSWQELIIRWEKTLELITQLLSVEVFGIDLAKGETGQRVGSSFSAFPPMSDDGTLLADQSRPRSSASSDAEGLSIHMLSSSTRSEASATDSGSLGELPETDESEPGKGDTLTPGEGYDSLQRMHKGSGMEYEDALTVSADRHLDTSRSTSTPDSLRESLNSPLFFPSRDGSRIRATSSCSSVSIMAGGSLQGWSQDSACALWFRVFGVMGKINDIQSPHAHKFAMESIQRIVGMLHEIQEKRALEQSFRENLTSVESFSPIALVAPLLIQTMSLPSAFHSSHLIALKMLCDITFRSNPIPKSYLVRFYQVLHNGLLSGNCDIIDVIFTKAGMKLFCSPTSLAFMLLQDLVSASETVLKSNLPELQLQSIRLLHSVLSYLELLPLSFSCFQPTLECFGMKNCSKVDLENSIHELLRHYTTSEFIPSVQVAAFHALGFTVCQNLADPSRLSTSSVSRLLSPFIRAMEQPNRDCITDVVGVLFVISNYAETLSIVHFPSVVTLIEVLCSCLKSVLFGLPANFEEEKAIEQAAISIVLCLCEWLVLVPKVLFPSTPDDTSISLRHSVAEVLEAMMAISETALFLELDHSAGKLDMEPRSKKRGLSEHFIPDRRLSMDVAALMKSEEEPGLGRRGTAFFGRANTDHSKDKERKEPIPTAKIDVRVQPLFREGRFRAIRLAGCYVTRQISNLFQNIRDPKAWTASASLFSEYETENTESFSERDTQVFCIYDVLISISSTPVKEIEDRKLKLVSPNEFPRTRVISRDIAGKCSLDIRSLFGQPSVISKFHQDVEQLPSCIGRKVEKLKPKQPDMSEELPDTVQTFDDLIKEHSEDIVLDILRYVDRTSPDLGLSASHPWNNPGPPPNGISKEQEEATSRMMLTQHDQMTEFVEDKYRQNKMFAEFYERPKPHPPENSYSYCYRFLSHYGFMGAAKRQHLWLINRTPEMLRDLKLLDRQPNRDTQKIAVIYIAKGQEDKMSIMTNNTGSRQYEGFLTRLGWNVDLNNHLGFRGGLPKDSWQFTNALYFATPTQEVMFHVATRVGALSTEDHTRKMRHIGNDEVQIIWSDHYRDYDRKMLPTQFGDVIICIYPYEPEGLFRIQILQRESIPPFGPLFDGAVVGEENLAVLVRNTALNAGRACRRNRTGFKHFFEERADYVRSLILNYSIETTYEQFLSHIVSPQQSKQSVATQVVQDHSAHLRPAKDPAVRPTERVRSLAVSRSGDAASSESLPLASRYSFPMHLGSIPNVTDV